MGGTWELTAINRTIVGAGDKYALGDVGGEETHTLTVNEMPSHNHRPEYSLNNGSTFNDAAFGRNGGTAASQYLACTNSVTLFNSYQVRMSFAGGGQPHNNMSPYVAYYIWKRIA